MTSVDGAAGEDRAAGTAAEDAAAEGRPTTPSEDMKAKFKAALDRKNSASHRTSDGDANTGSVHASETAGPVQKMFRRKSG
ncbi:DUF5302 family protein [Antribacter gilvus]|uniref:DUF5302 family protein n=1 Tax=Antribacter gilvus TaxID=2304675 RepID=UPI000F781B2F